LGIFLAYPGFGLGTPLFVLAIFMKIATLRKANQFMDSFNNSDFKEMMKEMEKEKN